MDETREQLQVIANATKQVAESFMSDPFPGKTYLVLDGIATDLVGIRQTLERIANALEVGNALTVRANKHAGAMWARNLISKASIFSSESGRMWMGRTKEAGEGR